MFYHTHLVDERCVNTAGYHGVYMLSMKKDN